MIYESLHGSLVAFVNTMVDARKLTDPDNILEFVDWEAHANINELPTRDLIGTTAVSFSEEEPDVFAGSMTIGVSTYANDQNLFRLRNIVGEVFRQLRPGEKIPFYDHETLMQKGWLYVVNGTTVLPMTKADVRPLQFVQCSFVFDAMTATG
jgi:hypothetical protein